MSKLYYGPIYLSKDKTLRRPIGSVMPPPPSVAASHRDTLLASREVGLRFKDHASPTTVRQAMARALVHGVVSLLDLESTNRVTSIRSRLEPEFGRYGVLVIPRARSNYQVRRE